MAYTYKNISNVLASNKQNKKRKVQVDGLTNLNKYERISQVVSFSKDDYIEKYIKSTLSPLGQAYLAQLINPFDFRDSPIHSIHPYGRSSKIYTSGARFTFQTSTATGGKGYGFVSVTPFYMHQNTTTSIYHSQSTSILAKIPSHTEMTTSTNYIAAVSCDSPFDNSDFAANQREYRLVCCAVRCRNITQRDEFGGSIIGVHTPNNGSGNGFTFSSACDFEHTKPYPFNGEWTTVFWTPTHPDNHVFWPSHTTSFTSPTGWDYNQIFLIIQAPDETVPTKVECEVCAVFECIGFAERGCEPRARDAEDAVRALSYLQNCCSYQGNPDTLCYSIPYDSF